MGYVYLINELGSNNFKIGVTKHNDINKRKRNLETGNSEELFVSRSYKTDNPFKLERLLHRHYHKNHINKEWYLLTDDEVMDFNNICDKYNSTINLLLSENPFY